MSDPRLVTIGISHFCEKARWALEWAGIRYTEEAHVPVMHLLPMRLAGGRSTPVLLWGERTLRDSTDILHAIDEAAERGRKLYPEDAGARREVEELEDLFDEKLGPAVRRATYHLLLEHRELAVRLLGAGTSGIERRALPLLFPVVRVGIRKSMRIDAEGAARSRAVIDRVFEEVARRLEGGRHYLVGDTFTAADLTLAALAAPSVLAPEYGVPLPGLDESPADIAQVVREARATPAGGHALRMYREHRRRVPG